MGRRRLHSKEFKLEAVRLATAEGASVKATADHLGINSSMFHTWISELRVDGGEAFPGNGRLKPDDEEMRKLRLQLKRVTEERDILAKATLFFAQEGRRK